MKKYFTINNQFKKYLPIFMIMLSIILLMGTSYALLRNSQKGEETYVMNVGLLEVTFLDSETNALTVENMVPTTDEEGKLIEDELEFTVKNTGSLSAKYNVYIEETSTNPEFKTVIRYISNKNDEGYNDPKTLSEDNYLDQLAFLDVGETVTYKVKFWLSESADTTYMDKTFTARIVVDVMQGNAPISSLVKESIKKSTCNPSVTDDDGTIYLSGTNDCVNFNYVWYSGKLWRVTALYPDGTMKMITEDIITTINWGAESIFYDANISSPYSASYVREWLNQEFLPTLYNYENIIVTDAGWYSVNDNSTPYDTPPKPEGDYTLIDPIGLLNSYEHYKSYQNTTAKNGYLNIGFYWWFINPQGDSSYVNRSDSDGKISGNHGMDDSPVRPVINLKSTIELKKGSGTVNDPYMIKSDKEEILPNTTLLNTRSSGEYIKISSDTNNNVFRIVNTETIGDNLTTKLVLNSYVKDTNDLDKDGDTQEVLKKYFTGESTSVFNDNVSYWTRVDKTDITYWRGYLNNVWIKEIDSTYSEIEGISSILEKGIYYLGEYGEGKSYKTTVCTTISSDVRVDDCIKNGVVVSNKSSDDYVGLLRVGEIFATQLVNSVDKTIWLITPGDNFYPNYVRYVSYIGSYTSSTSANASTNEHAVFPSINLKSTVVIKSGSGTEQDPFVVGLPS